MSGYNMFRKDIESHSSAILWKKNCIICGHVSANSICEECMNNAREHFDGLMEYLAQNPRSTMMEVYGNTTIPYKVIKAFLELGWLTLVLEDEETRIRSRDVIMAIK